MATVSMYDATHGYAAKTTAARDAKGNIVGDSTGSKYARQQEAQEAQEAQKAQAAQTAAQQAQAQKQAPVYSTIYQQQNELLQAQIKAVEAERAPVPKAESIVSKVASKIGVKDQLDTANEKLSAHIPTLETIQEKRDTALEKVGLLDERQKVTEAIRSNQLTAGIQNYYLGGYKGLKEAPVSFAAGQGVLLAGGAVGGAVLKGAGIAGRVGLTKIGLSKLAGAVEPTINVGLGAATVYEASKLKTVEEGAGFVSDIALMGVGYKTGTKASLKTYDVIRTKGLKEVPIKSLVKEPVLSGKEEFPMTKTPDAAAVLNSFRDPTTGAKIGYHATISELGSTPSVHGAINPKHLSDVPGLYISPVQEGASPNFLRMGGESLNPLSAISKGLHLTIEGVKTENKKEIKQGLSSIKEGILGTSDPLTPNVLKISLNEVTRLPENIRYGEWIDTPKGPKFRPIGAQNYLLSPEAPKGTSFLTPLLESKTKSGIPAEAEAVIVPETILSKTGESSYFKWEGRRVKLQEYKINDSSIIESKTPKADMIESKRNSLSHEKSLTSAEELTATYRAEAPATKGILSEKGYLISSPTYRPNIPGIEGRGSIPNIDSRANVPRIESRGSTPNIDSRSNIPEIESRGSIPNIDSRANVPRIESRGSTPNIDSRSNIPEIESRGSIPNIDSRSYIPKIGNIGVIPTGRITTVLSDVDDYTSSPITPFNTEFERDLDPLKDSTKHKKTKKKMLKNTYGDPFNTKTKF